jgi:hypothetical protein
LKKKSILKMSPKNGVVLEKKKKRKEKERKKERRSRTVGLAGMFTG